MKKNSFLEGAFVATLAIIVSKILGLIYVIPFYSIIGEQGGALYGYAYNIYNLFLTISTAGIPLAISKLTSEYNTLGMISEKEKMYKVARNLIMSFSVISFLICFIFAPQLAHIIIGDMEGGNSISDIAFVIRMVSFALLIIPFLSVLRGYLQGHKYITEPSISQVIEQFVRVAVILGGSLLCLKVFKLSLTTTIGVVVFGAAIGGISAYLYLMTKYRKNKEKISPKCDKKSSVTSKEITKKIIIYAIPFIIISVANNLYFNVDMVLMLRTLTKLGYTALETETVSSIFTTWGVKINIIVLSIATGLITSLIPHVTSSYVKKDMDEVNEKFNKGLKILLLVIVPLAIFISLNADSVWILFYGSKSIGAKIIRYSILVTIIECAYMMFNSLFQGINKSKLIYISVIVGLGLNAILDIPLMHLFNSWGLEAYYGAICATFIGYTVSVLIAVIYLKKKLNFNYKATVKMLPRVILGVLLMVATMCVINLFIDSTLYSRWMQIPILVFCTLLLFGIFFLTNYKEYMKVIPENVLKKLKIKK